MPKTPQMRPVEAESLHPHYGCLSFPAPVACFVAGPLGWPPFPQFFVNGSFRFPALDLEGVA